MIITNSYHTQRPLQSGNYCKKHLKSLVVMFQPFTIIVLMHPTGKEDQINREEPNLICFNACKLFRNCIHSVMLIKFPLSYKLILSIGVSTACGESSPINVLILQNERPLKKSSLQSHDTEEVFMRELNRLMAVIISTLLPHKNYFSFNGDIYAA